MGEGGVGVFVGGGGILGCDGSVNECSNAVADSCCSLDSVMEDSDEEGEEGKGLLCEEVVGFGVIVSALGRVTKRP